MMSLPPPPDFPRAEYEPPRDWIAALRPLAALLVLPLVALGLWSVAGRAVHVHLPPPAVVVSGDFEPLGTSITPITAVSDGASGLAFSGDAYDVTCTTTAAASVLYPAMHDGTAWTIFTAYPCTNDGTITKITCVFPARRESGMTWNAYKTGAATVNACTATQRYNAVPISRPSGAPPGMGSVTSVATGTGLSGGPVTTTGTITLANTAVTPGSYTLASITVDQQGRLTAASSGTASGGAAGFYGAGSDGVSAVDGTNTFSWASKSGSTYTLTRDVFPTTLTLTNSAIVKVGGCRVIAKTSITVGSGSAIHADGAAAAASVAGAGASSYVVGGGGGGGTGQAAAGNNGTFINSAQGAAGGAGGAGSVGGAGNAGSANALTDTYGGFPFLPGAIQGVAIGTSGVATVGGGSGGGGGGGDGANAGGGGGGGGGVLIIAAPTITNSGRISANGGAGGDAAAGNAGGGGGGGGGCVVAVYASLTGSAIQANGGAGGAKTGTGVAGVAGSAGNVFALGN